MAKKFCTYIPSKGNSLFKDLKKQFGYETARQVFLIAISPKFMNEYKGTLSITAEGIPSYSSLLKNSYIKEVLGDTRISRAINDNYKPLEDTLDNYNSALEEALSFNTSSEFRQDYVAIVDHVGEDKIGVKILPKSESNITLFNNQYASARLNNKMIELFRPLGLKVGMLSEAEVQAGRVGVTDFSKARDIAVGFSSIIRVANNMEGAQALPEEFSHLLVGMFKDEPLVARSLTLLSNNEEAIKTILGNDFSDVVKFYNGDMRLVAEEALGHVLQKNLLNDRTISETPAPSLFKRVINFIVRKFKGYNPREIDSTINEVEASMSKLATSILKGTTKVTTETIKNSAREVQLNALSDRIKRNIELLKETAKREAKLYKISEATNKSVSEKTVSELLEYTEEDSDTVLGIFNYARVALEELKSLEGQFETFDTMPSSQKFGFLRSVRMYTQIYGTFIQSLNDMAIEEKGEEDNMFERNFGSEENPIYLGETLKELNNESQMLASNFVKKAKPAFAEFLKPFFGEKLVIPFGKDAGKEITVESLLVEAERDISFLDRWLDSMGDSSDLLLQLFDTVVQKANHTARETTRFDIMDIQNLMLWAENHGITNFEWMFEMDEEGNKSGNYIKEINEAQFNLERDRMEKALNEKYGVNPKGQAAKDKMNERDAWLDTHAVFVFEKYLPDPRIYANKVFKSLSADKKKFLNDFLAIKQKFDDKLPDKRVSLHKAIQMRKSSSNRILESLKSPDSIIDNVKASISNTFLESEDDDLIFGENRARKGLTDFEGNEFLTLPVLYTNRLKDPNELTTDVFASLMSYAYMANSYEEMNKIVDPLEIGRIVSTGNNRKIRETRGDNTIIEKFDSLGMTIANKVYRASGTNFEQKLKDFFDSKVYHKYLKDEGTFSILGKEVNINKLVSWILKGSSLAQLGFNGLANTANVATGVAMQNIEAASGQYFTVSELARADKEYASAMKEFVPQIGSRIKTSKLALFDDFFNVKQDFEIKVKKNQMKKLLQKVFGENLAFLGQEAGDHWLYNRTAIAMALREKVLLDGKEMSLWEAIKTRNRFKGNDKIKELNIKDIKNLDGSDFDTFEFERRVKHVNQNLFGIYNEEDANAANRVAAGRLIMHYRKWMKPSFNKRFQKGQFNLSTREFEEGYYRTSLRIMVELAKGKYMLATVWDELRVEEKRNIIKTITELAQFLAVWALANWVEWPDDKKRPWALKYAEYSAKRLAHELGGLTPSTVFLQENLKTLKTPIASLTVVGNTINLFDSLISPSDWTDELQSGPYEGHSTLVKNILKSPIPGIAQYKQIDRFIDGLEDGILYYARPY